MTICVAIVDTQTLFREGMKALLSQYSDIQVIGLAADSATAIALLTMHPSDVALIEMQLPGMNGIALTDKLQSLCPTTRVIILTRYDDDIHIFAALEAGAAGYLLKNTTPEFLTTAIRLVADGQTVLDPLITSQVIHRAKLAGAASPSLRERLTHRELDVLHLVSAGHSNREIAVRLHLCEGTIKNYMTRIIEKLGARNRTHAAQLAIEWGFLDKQR